MGAAELIPSRPAQYPALYESARVALIRCAQVDECQEWASKAAAIEVYARLAKDDSLVIMAQRIQARAIRRMGELLKEIPHLHGPGSSERGVTRTTMARNAGLSLLQQRQAAQVAQIPAKQFERIIESKKVPRIYKLAEIGVRKRGARTEKSLRRNLELAEAQVVRHQARLVKAIEKVDELKKRLELLEEKK